MEAVSKTDKHKQAYSYMWTGKFKDRKTAKHPDRQAYR